MLSVFEINITPIVIGVLSSIVFTSLLWGVKMFYKKYLHPWVQNKYYKSFNFKGIWYEEKEVLGSEVKQMSKIKIKQKGRRLNGYIEITKNTGFENLDKKRVFNLKGNISNNIIVISSICKDNREIGGQSYILKAISNGHTLVGKKIYYDISSDFQINIDNVDYFKCIDIVWYRKQNIDEFKEFRRKSKNETN